MTSMDDDVATAVFLMLNAAVTRNEVAYTRINASSSDGIAEVTLMAVPSYLAKQWIDTVKDHKVRNFGNGPS